MFIRVVMVVTLALGAADGCVNIYSIRGMVGVIPRNTKCTFLLNGAPVTADVLMTSRSYGLIQTSCDDCIVNHISKFDGCDDCWICAHNEGVISCRSKALPILIGTITSLLVVASMVAIVMYLCKKFDLVDKLLAKLIRVRAERKRAKLAKREIHLNDLISRRLRPASAPLYPDLTSIDEEPIKQKPVSAKPPLGGSVSPAVLLALGLASASQVRACDDVLFMSSSGVMYVDGAMSTMSTGLAYLHVGNTLCFKHEDGSKEELKVDKITIAENYGASYKTCDFTLDFKSSSSCLGSGLCWDSSTCKHDSRLGSVGPKAYTVPESQMGCRLVPNMDDPCVHRQKCVWYYWDILPVADKCDIIYETLGHTKLVHFTHTSANGDVVPFSLSMDNPAVAIPITLHLGSIHTEYYPTYRNVRKHGEIPLGATAASRNEGIAGLLGDLQLPLVSSTNSSDWSYPTHEIVCQPDGRTVMCNTAPPAYTTSLAENSKHVLEGAFDSTSLFFIRTRQVKGVVNVVLRSKPIVSQVIEQASCDVELETTYACTSCDEMPHIIVTPRSVRRTGLMQFTSNCSFFIPEVLCSDQPQILRMTNRPDSCWIKFKDTNQTLNFSLNYEFLGQIYYRGVMTFKPEEDFSGKMKLAMQSPDFLNSLKFSAALGFATAALLGLVKMTLRYIIFKRGVKEENEMSA